MARLVRVGLVAVHHQCGERTLLDGFAGGVEARFGACEFLPCTDGTLRRTAEAAHVPGARLAKSVVLEDGEKYLLAVVPATHSVDIGALYRRFGREIGLASEEQIAKLFADCEPGAVPPVGQVYGIETILDEAFVDAEDVYFEGGDHRALVHVNGSDFLKLMRDTPRARIGLPH